ncbi:hypothetical protein CASFOL_023180 [Castilleja foliolosa]|uniref:Cystatin domain-containing protein n=1 Tax=Castilleja foliolosa TaxID=1961234 RepID=A0ABD3CLJ6_9LAMI
MAKVTIIPHLLLLLILPLMANAIGGRVGGRTQLKNVEGNKEVQDLGKYCVQEYNRQQQQKGNGRAKLLFFSRVVEAETQVVSGIKYYLKIAARGGGSAANSFEAVVVVKPWLHSKQLINFAPSTPSKNTK